MSKEEADLCSGKVLTIRKKEYETIESLGSGGYGSVCLALDTSTGEHVAIKMSREPITRDAIVMKNFDTKDCKQYFVCFRAFGSFRYNDVRYNAVVMDYYPGMYSLASFITVNRHKLDAAKRLIICKNIIKVFKILVEKYRIIHNDIKPENILIDQDYNVRYIDYGTSCTFDDFKGYAPTCLYAAGTYYYMAPEKMFIEGREISHEELLASDLWSLGMTCYYVLFEDNPFFAYGSEALREHLDEATQSDIDVELPGVEVYPFLQQLLRVDPYERTIKGIDERIDDAIAFASRVETVDPATAAY